MPKSLSVRATAVLVTLAFGLTFAVHALLGGASSAAKPAARKAAAAFVADAPGATPDLKLVASKAVPALREPRQPRKPKVHHRKRAHTPAVRKVVRAPSITPAPMTPAPRSTPTPTPRYIPPAPRHVTPKPAKPKATPAPTAAPPSGDFDTDGQP
jgi:hypothetical protein